MSITAKITRKGQVTVPKQIRKLLDSDVIEFEVSDGEVLIRPVKSVAGSLSTYAKGPSAFKEVRDAVWDEVVKDTQK